MIEEILPATVVTEEAYTDPPHPPTQGLFPEEVRAVAQAVEKRQREYATVRRCARRALGRLGLPPVPLLSSKRGAPQWPDGVVGSMTHCDGYRAAVVARSTDVASVGIDAEPDGPLPDGVLDVISLPAERAWLRTLAATRPGGPHWERLLFCAKESVFKTWYPLTLEELDFSEAEITVDASAGTFFARLLVPGPVLGGRRLPSFTGRWVARDGLIVTAILLPAPVAESVAAPVAEAVVVPSGVVPSAAVPEQVVPGSVRPVGAGLSDVAAEGV